MDAELMLCRALHFAASLLIFGILLFQSLIAPKPLAIALAPKLKRLTITCALVAAITSFFWLVLLATGVSDSPDTAVSIDLLTTVLLDTQFGAVWQWHMGLCLALAVVVSFDRFLPAGLRWPIATTFAMLQIVTLARVGHAVMLSGGLGIANRVTQALHLMAGGCWLGSLVPLVLCLSLRVPALRGDIATAVRRFSNVGHAAVVLVIVSGFINMDLITGRLDLWPRTLYQSLLDVKILVVAAMVGLAIINRYWLVPRLREDAAALEVIRRISVAVFALGLAAVSLVSVFGMLSPT